MIITEILLKDQSLSDQAVSEERGRQPAKGSEEAKALIQIGCGGELSRRHQDNKYTFLEVTALQLTTG